MLKYLFSIHVLLSSILQLRADSQRSTAKSLIGRSIGIIRASLESVQEAFGDGRLLEALDAERKQPTLALFQV